MPLTSSCSTIENFSWAAESKEISWSNLERWGTDKRKCEVHQEVCWFKEVNCNSAFEPGERDANDAGDATTKVVAKIQGIEEANSGESDDGNIWLGSFVIVLHKNLWGSIWSVGGLWEVDTIKARISRHFYSFGCYVRPTVRRAYCAEHIVKGFLVSNYASLICFHCARKSWSLWPGSSNNDIYNI